jgi:hypothetical protein
MSSMGTSLFPGPLPVRLLFKGPAQGTAFLSITQVCLFDSSVGLSASPLHWQFLGAGLSLGVSPSPAKEHLYLSSAVCGD